LEGLKDMIEIITTGTDEGNILTIEDAEVLKTQSKVLVGCLA